MILLLIISSIVAVKSRLQSDISYISNSSKEWDLYSIIVHNWPSCKHSAFCKLIEKLGVFIKQKLDTDLISVQVYNKQPTSLQGRSYYNGFGTPATTTYYPTFDPISVLASLAFLAFLLQSFASLFDRSRSILPTVNSREANSQLKIIEASRHIPHILDE